ncbi:MAG: holin [Verrucomicrobia bacterium]|jgi:hypothetical protein|nr:holin [Verrucomicrobiota bacterium]
MSDHQAAFEAAAAASASKVMYTGAGATVGGLFTGSMALPLVGLFIALAGFFVNTYYQRRRDEREARESAWRMRVIQTQAGELAE